MAHLSITLPKEGFGNTSTIASMVYNTNRPVIPAAWMADGQVGEFGNLQITSTGREGTTDFAFTVLSGDLISGWEQSGYIFLTYRGLKVALDIGTAVVPDTVGGTYRYALGVRTEIFYQVRTMFERMVADKAAGGLTEDPILTLWDEQGDNPVPDEPLSFSSEQTITVPASGWDVNSARYAAISPTPRPQFDAAFTPSGEDRFHEQFIIRRDRTGIILFVGDSESGTSSAAVALNQDFLTKGRIEVTVRQEGSTFEQTLNLDPTTATILDRGAIDEPYRMDWGDGTPEAVRMAGFVTNVNVRGSSARFVTTVKLGILGAAAVLPDASAPTSIAVNPVPNGGEGSSVVLGATLSGGVYDELEYRWSVFDGSTNVTSTVLDDHEIATPTFTRPSVSANKNFTIGVRVNAKGTGTKAKSGTSAPVTSLSVTTTVINLVAVSPPNVQMTLDGTVFTDGASINGNEGDISALGVELTGGTYDTIAYIWEVKKLNETALLQAVHRAKDYPWQRPAVHGSNEIVTVSVEISVNGNGTTARPGNVRTQRVAHNTTIFNVADEGIFYGRKKIKNVYYGEKKIVAIYYGEKEVATFN